MISRRLLAASLAVAAAATAAPAVANADFGNDQTSTYRVTIENLTPPGSQPMSPAGVAIHNRRTDVWSVGQPASAAVAAVAEDANLGIFVASYGQTPGVSAAFVGGAAPFAPGTSISFEFDATRRDRISLVSMLVNTNDAFTGLDAVKLKNSTQVFEVGAYDAGTEANTELAADIPGQGHPFVRAPEGGVVGSHAGIVGTPGGLDPAVYGWDDPVARITIEKIG